ncbi:MAG: hypothetical protein VYB15_07665 [Planctomycetota bacterium]|nr:hypothetical protein [Planctomycetota bacterium]MEE3297139.1 hypothetical protein [Planctomycetota bacterium]
MERVHRRKRRQPVKGIAGALLCHLFFFILQGEFVILLDPTARLARQLSVHSYPTYIYFDTKGKEVQRYLDIQSVWKFFDIERFQELGRPQPASASEE